MRGRRFTLAEVLVAVLVAAVVIPIALRALMTVAGLDEAAARRQQAAFLADLKLRELVATGDWTDLENSGDFGDDYPGYDWELEDDEWVRGDVAMRSLAVTVRGPGRGTRTQVTLTTVVPEQEE